MTNSSNAFDTKSTLFDSKSKFIMTFWAEENRNEMKQKKMLEMDY